jgi:hypothetical protein
LIYVILDKKSKLWVNALIYVNLSEKELHREELRRSMAGEVNEKGLIT